MANKTISDLPEKTTANNTDYMIIENSSETNKISKANLLKDIGDLSSLSTTNKTNLVQAINELYNLIKNSGGSSGGGDNGNNGEVVDNPIPTRNYTKSANVNPNMEQQSILAKCNEGDIKVNFETGTYTLSGLGSFAISGNQVMLEGNGSTIELNNKAELIALGENIHINNFKIKPGSSATGQWGTACVKPRNDGFILSNCVLEGVSWLYGVYIGSIGNGYIDNLYGGYDHVNDCIIYNNKFSNFSYTIFKNASNIDGEQVPCNNFKCCYNTITDVINGDAIEMNIGRDEGYYIYNNIIRNVDANGVANAGIGIGIAGGMYEDAAAKNSSRLTRKCYIYKNTIDNCNLSGVHFEACCDIEIHDNKISNSSPIGIEVYGSYNCKMYMNEIINCSIGILDSCGVYNGKYIIGSSTDNVINNNIITSSAEIGAFCVIIGEGCTSSVTNNTISDCGTGIKYQETPNPNINGNNITNCTKKTEINGVITQ